jgi:ABC-2 type transport system ATP-binding protein
MRLAQLEGVSDVEVTPGRLDCRVHGNFSGLLGVLGTVTVTNLVSHEPSLEEVFLAYYGKQAYSGPERRAAPRT